MSNVHIDGSVAIIRTISHDFKEPLRSVRWYLRKLRDFSDMDRQLQPAVDDFDEIIKFTQHDFQRFYEDYRNRQIQLAEFRTFIRTILGKHMLIIESNWGRLYPVIRDVKFIDPRVERYPDINVSSLNETVKRIVRRYEGLKRYIDVRNEPQRKPLGLQNEVQRVIGDLKAIITTEKAECAVSGALVARFDQTLISLIFQNLIVNSIKYRRENHASRIQIAMGIAHAEVIADYVPRSTNIAALTEAGGQIGFVVYSDNGRGIPPAYAEAAFKPFIQVNPTDPAGGSGMGLAIVRSAVESQEGVIWLKSRMGIGTTFFMLFRLDNQTDARPSSEDDIRAWFATQGGVE